MLINFTSMETGIIISIGRSELQDIISEAVKEGIGRYENTFKHAEISDRKVFLKYKKAAEYLQMSVSKLRTLVAKKSIPFYQDDRSIYFLQDDLECWLLSIRNATKEENEQEFEDKLNNFYTKNIKAR